MTGASQHRKRVRRSAQSRLTLGMLMIIVAVVLGGFGRLLAQSGQHAYDPDAQPPTSYQLSATKTYQLSASGGVRGLKRSGVIAEGVVPQCFYASARSTLASQRPVSLLSTKDDDRDLQVFATFRVPESGKFRISCTRIASVFVDDADNSQPGYSALLVVLCAIAGAFGVGLAISGWAGDFSGPGSEARPVDGASENKESEKMQVKPVQ